MTKEQNHSTKNAFCIGHQSTVNEKSLIFRHHFVKTQPTYFYKNKFMDHFYCQCAFSQSFVEVLPQLFEKFITLCVGVDQNHRNIGKTMLGLPQNTHVMKTIILDVIFSKTVPRIFLKNKLLHSFIINMFSLNVLLKCFLSVLGNSSLCVSLLIRTTGSSER